MRRHRHHIVESWLIYVEVEGRPGRHAIEWREVERGEHPGDEVVVVEHIVEVVAELGANREQLPGTRTPVVFPGLPPAAHPTSSGPRRGFITARRSSNLRLRTMTNRVPVTAALPLRSVGKEKSPGIPVNSGFSGLYLWRYRWDLNPRWS